MQPGVVWEFTALPSSLEIHGKRPLRFFEKRCVARRQMFAFLCSFSVNSWGLWLKIEIFEMKRVTNEAGQYWSSLFIAIFSPPRYESAKRIRWFTFCVQGLNRAETCAKAIIISTLCSKQIFRNQKSIKSWKEISTAATWSVLKRTPKWLETISPIYGREIISNFQKIKQNMKFLFLSLRFVSTTNEKERNPFCQLMIVVRLIAKRWRLRQDYATWVPKTVLTQSIVRNKRFHLLCFNMCEHNSQIYLPLSEFFLLKYFTFWTGIINNAGFQFSFSVM